jgi:polyhydroxyalkanoate synthesis regulator phasin
MELLESVRKALLAGFGAQDRLKEMVDDFVRRGEISESQGAKLVREWSDRANKGSSEMGKGFSDAIGKLFAKMNIPDRDEIDRLDRKLKKYSTRLKKLEEKMEDRAEEE